MKKECETCKYCESLEKAEDKVHFFTTVDCIQWSVLKFPMGSTPTCNSWEEKDPTLKELRDEVRDLKKQLRERKCREVRVIEKECCNDCCKCKCRCNRYHYRPPYWYTSPYTWYCDTIPSTPTLSTWTTAAGNTLTIGSGSSNYSYSTK
jgi:hypothetical protein